MIGILLKTTICYFMVNSGTATSIPPIGFNINTDQGQCEPNTRELTPSIIQKEIKELAKQENSTVFAVDSICAACLPLLKLAGGRAFVAYRVNYKGGDFREVSTGSYNVGSKSLEDRLLISVNLNSDVKFIDIPSKLPLLSNEINAVFQCTSSDSLQSKKTITQSARVVAIFVLVQGDPKQFKSKVEAQMDKQKLDFSYEVPSFKLLSN